jgi:hypothetical protein
MNTADAALREIETAFGDLPYPGAECLLHPGALDDHEIDIGKLRGHTSWRSVPDPVLELEDAALGALSAAAFQFFVPAYMHWTLRHFSSSDAFTVDSTIYALAPHLGTPEFRISKFALLTSAQISAVVAFLRVMAASPDFVDAGVAQEALRTYWLPRLESCA